MLHASTLSRILRCNRSPTLRLLNCRRHASSLNPKGQNYQLALALSRSLEEMSSETQFASAKNSPYRLRAVTQAIKKIDRLPFKIESPADASQIKGVGPGIMRRIEAFFRTGTCDTESSSSNPMETEEEASIRRAKHAFQTISGIGPKKAADLIAAGARTLDDLRRDAKYLEMLSHASKVAVMYGGLDTRIMRSETELVENVLKESLHPEMEFMITGSYRRGQTSSSDIDVLLTHSSYDPQPDPPDAPGFKSKGKARAVVVNAPSEDPTAKPVRRRKKGTKPLTTPLQDIVIPRLTKHGLLADALTSGPKKWQGVVRIPFQNETINDRLEAIRNGQGRFRRIDFNLVPIRSKGAALIQLTGDIEFNRMLRMVAKRNKMTLNEYGLWKSIPQPQQEPKGLANPEELEENPLALKGVVDATPDPVEVGPTWERVDATSEEDIFDALGMQPVAPSERNFSNVMYKR